MWGSGPSPGPRSQPTADERTFTPWAQPGWRSWDAWSPEEDFCRFVGVLRRMLQPEIVVETGVGVGRLTAYLSLDDCVYIGFESADEWRQDPALPDRDTPTEDEMATADLVILDSDPPYRLRELAMWAEVGKPGSTCVVHDAGSGHPEGAIHSRVREAIEATDITGIYLANPRGGWVAQHP